MLLNLVKAKCIDLLRWFLWFLSFAAAFTLLEGSETPDKIQGGLPIKVD